MFIMFKGLLRAAFIPCQAGSSFQGRKDITW
jgi:hypothetical protein